MTDLSILARTQLQSYRLKRQDREESLSEARPSPFSLRQAYLLVNDLMAPRPLIYWADFLFHISLAWGAFVLIVRLPAFSALQLVALVTATLAFYRAVIFIHELAHFKKGRFKAFRQVWNLLCGYPLLLPSFTYDGVHNEHHKRNIYGTAKDGEYQPFAVQDPSHIIGFLLLSFIIPSLLYFRFLCLTPLSYLVPPLRRWVWAHASSLTIDARYVRPKNALRNDRHWRAQEFMTFLYAAIATALVGVGYLPLSVFITWYAITFLILILNSLRTLAAHAYRNPGEKPMGLVEQYLDSIDIPGNPVLTPLWAPVGLRYHATHHLFPSMPYHNLAKAHLRLNHEINGEALAAHTVRKSLWAALRGLWKESSRNTSP